MIAVVRNSIPVRLPLRLCFSQCDLKPRVLCSVKRADVGRCHRKLEDIRIPDRVRGHWEYMSHCHHEVISHRMQVGVMRVGWVALNVEPTVSNVAVSIGTYLRDTEVDVIATGRCCSRALFPYCGSRRKTGLFFCCRSSAVDKSEDQALGQNCCPCRPAFQHFKEHVLSNLLRAVR